MLSELHMFCLILFHFNIVLPNFAMKLKEVNFWHLQKSFFKSHWNILVFCNQWKISDLNLSYGKVSDFILIPFFWVHFGHKTEKFSFWQSLKYFFNIFWSKNDVRFEYVLPNSVWFGLSFVVWVEFWK